MQKNLFYISDIVFTTIRESTANQLKNIFLSNNTISHRIHDISDNINEQLVDELKNKHFAIQLDEITDSKDLHLICYVRFMDGIDFKDEIIFQIYFRRHQD